MKDFNDFYDLMDKEHENILLDFKALVEETQSGENSMKFKAGTFLASRYYTLRALELYHKWLNE